MTDKIKSLATDVFTALFIILFVYAASNKLADYEKFRVQLGKSPLLTPFSAWAGWLVIGSELAIAIGLCFKKIQLRALYAAFTIMVMFSVYILIILHFSEYIPCSCGGILENMNWGQHLVFNSCFVCLGAAAVLLYPDPKKQRAIAIEGDAENLKPSRH